MAEVHRRLGLKVAGGTYSSVFRHTQRLGLDVSHFKGQGWSRGNYKTTDELRADLLPLLARASGSTNSAIG
jgi:hypothetical protein